MNFKHFYEIIKLNVSKKKSENMNRYYIEIFFLIFLKYKRLNIFNFY